MARRQEKTTGKNVKAEAKAAEPMPAGWLHLNGPTDLIIEFRAAQALFTSNAHEGGLFSHPGA